MTVEGIYIRIPCGSRDTLRVSNSPHITYFSKDFKSLSPVYLISSWITFNFKNVKRKFLPLPDSTVG